VAASMDSSAAGHRDAAHPTTLPASSAMTTPPAITGGGVEADGAASAVPYWTVSNVLAVHTSRVLPVCGVQHGQQ
jgi:hypothetical protein